MFERQKQSRLGALTLLSLIVFMTSSLSSTAHARRRSRVNKANQNGHHLEQSSDGYQEFYVPEVPFSLSDDYLKFNSFIIGAKISDTYEYTDDCLYDVVEGLDQQAYFNNNITQHNVLLESGDKESYFEPYLNFTGIVYGPIADALPNCYAFTYSFYQVENDRFLTFNSNWGNFFLAFLFNQMGNALNFQTKFERIQTERERQNFAGMWQEYGDLFYLIWTFSPIEEASLENVSSFIAKWMEENEWINDKVAEAHRPMVHATATGFARYVHSAGEAFGLSLAAASTVVGNTFKSKVDQFSQKKEELLQAEYELPFVGPVVGQTVTQNIAQGANGVFTGIVDVFPYDSNPTRCQGNFTNGYNAGERFYKRIFDEATRDAFDVTSVEDQEDVIDDISDLLKLPFGASYSCYWGFSTILVNEDPLADGVLTEEEELEELIMINNEYLTNIFFNLGYIYQAGYSIYALFITSQDDDNFIRDVGIYSGDILIRFFWRQRFTRNFEY